MPDDIMLRLATPADAPLLAEHRVAMFREMGSIKPAREPALRAASHAYFAAALASGEYVGWVTFRSGAPDHPLAGAGVQVRSLLPRPNTDGDGLLLGREALVLNVYTDPSWRRRGLARQLMSEIVRWAATAGVVRLVLHASTGGRPLYESLGFAATNEMRYTGPLAAAGPVVGGERDPG
jgi:GNAT superfamily N-acetyltransferase